MCHFKILILNYKITCVLSHHIFLKPPYFLLWFQNLSFRALKERNLFFRAWFFQSHSFNMKINSFQCSTIYIFYWLYILKGKIPILDYPIWHTFTCIFHIYLYISFFVADTILLDVFLNIHCYLKNGKMYFYKKVFLLSFSFPL